MTESKGDKARKEERGRKDDKSKKAGGAKGTKGKRPAAARQQQTANEADTREQESIRDTLQKVLRKFPDVCTVKCKCEKMACDISQGKQKLLQFEALFKTKLEKQTKKAKDKEENLLHLLVRDEWRKPEHKTVAKRLLDWMLQQQEHETLLKLRDPRGFTPVHNALYDNVHDFIGIILEAEKLDTISILKKTDSAGMSCIHLAAQKQSLHLSAMIRRCNRDKEILMDGDRSEKATPLHIAVQNLKILIPVPEEDGDLEADTEGEGLEDNEGHQNQVPSDHNDDDVFAEVDGLNEDSDDDSDYKDSGMSESEEDSELEDESEVEEVNYRFEDQPERQKRLQRILDCLDKDNARPRPPPRVQDAKSGNLQQMDTEYSDNDQVREGNDSSISEVATTQELADLPPDHSVRLLIEACPEALMTKNSHKRTPYQEREHLLLDDDDVKQLVKQYAEKNGLRVDIVEAREARAKRMIIVEDPVARYIRSYCVRESKSREETMQQLYKPGQGELNVRIQAPDLSRMMT